MGVFYTYVLVKALYFLRFTGKNIRKLEAKTMKIHRFTSKPMYEYKGKSCFYGTEKRIRSLYNLST